MIGSKLSHLLTTIRVGRWILCLSHYALKCRNRIALSFKKRPDTKHREHVFHHGDYQVVLLSTEPMILKPAHSELPAALDDLPHDSNQHVFPVDLYLNQLKSARGLSECVQYGTSSKRLALELSGYTGNDDLTGNFVLHISDRDKCIPPTEN